MEESTKKYFQAYNDFLMEYKKGYTDGERIGEVIATFAQYFAMANADYANASIAFNKVASAIEQTDGDNGKPISSAKAKILSEATEEYSRVIETKARVENVEQMLNALKSFQKGIMVEWRNGNVS
jgi:hypothetical protein